MFFHSYNFLSPSPTFCFIFSSLVPSLSPRFDSHGFSFCSTVPLTISSSWSTVSASVLASNGSLSIFLPSSLHIYINTNVSGGGSVKVSLHSNFFCALFFCLMAFFFPFDVCFCLGCWICYSSFGYVHYDFLAILNLYIKSVTFDYFVLCSILLFDGCFFFSFLRLFLPRVLNLLLLGYLIGALLLLGMFIMIF